MDFKSRVSADITKVFLNNSFFGETVSINGQDVEVVIDEDALRERNLAILKSGKVHADDILFYCNAEVFRKGMPSVGRRMLFQEKDYLITSVKEDMGLLTISLSRNEG